LCRKGLILDENHAFVFQCVTQKVTKAV